MAEAKPQAPAEKVKAPLKKSHTHAGQHYEVAEGRKAPEIEVTERQKKWLAERGIV